MALAEGDEAVTVLEMCGYGCSHFGGGVAVAVAVLGGMTAAVVMAAWALGVSRVWLGTTSHLLGAFSAWCPHSDYCCLFPRTS